MRIAATPIKNEPSILPIADSFPKSHVLFLFLNRKGDSMGVRIEPIPNSVRVRISGDVETTLSVPYEDDDRFLVALSDGTLLVGSYDEDLRCKFDVARDGAGIVRFEGEAAFVDWRVEWATISVYDANVVELSELTPMPLFPDLEDILN
ncbi:hypothetical protein EGM87_01010 [Sphingobium sp. RSMS]|uniref:hypothetical protein n=1 Tax=Sphingobium sp. RSMS TaxID=520734 RepID=UPI0020A3151E|nr:hypothetical protein [Sphingobium sp. RSMS]UXC91103.1 hypothetical protein EGM87_01010 [Sphingobium sp. RSMS]